MTATSPASLTWLDRTAVLAAGGDDFALAHADVLDALSLAATGQAGMAAESALPMGTDPREKAYGLPAWLGGRFDAVGLKWTIHRVRPPGPGLPSNTSLTLLNAHSSGRPLGLVESGHLTTMRTATVSALAIERLMAEPPRQVALLGSGAQARCHRDMLTAFFPSTAITIWSRTPARAEALAAGSRNARPVARLPEALAGADCILCCTSSTEPILGPEAVRPGRLIVQAGFHEVEFDAIAACDVVAVDAWGDFAETSAKSLFRMYRAGRFRREDVVVDLAALVSGGWNPQAGKSTYFSSFGLNIFDIALAARVLRRATALGIGQYLPIFGPEGAF